MSSRTVPILIVAILLSAAAWAAPRNAQVTGVVNLNAATAAELMGLTGIGVKKAQRILAQRAKRRFLAVDQIMRVKGFGRLTYRKLKPYLAVIGPTTLAPVRNPGGWLELLSRDGQASSGTGRRR